MSDQLYNTVEKIFISLDGFDHLMGRYKEVESKTSFSELYAYATRPDFQPSPKLLASLSTDLSIKRDFNRLLENQSLAHFPQLAAASTQEVETRLCNDFEITLKASQANPDQLYLSIKAIDHEITPKLLFVLQEGQAPLRLEIEGFYDGEAQILLSSQDDIAKGLRNLKSEVILR